MIYFHSINGIRSNLIAKFQINEHGQPLLIMEFLNSFTSNVLFCKDIKYSIFNICFIGRFLKKMHIIFNNICVNVTSVYNEKLNSDLFPGKVTLR